MKKATHKKGLKILVMSGGGDCPGINAVIRGIVKSGILQSGSEFWGSRDGFDGIISNQLTPLDYESIRGIMPRGGTIIGTTNKGDPFNYKSKNSKGEIITQDLSSKVVQNFKKHKFDGLCVIGGNGTLKIAYQFIKLGIPLVCVPKTIDNDLNATDFTFGFQTAVQIAVDAIDRLHTTAESHRRTIIVELMGRDAGFLTLFSGVGGGAHVILLPEYPFDLALLKQAIVHRRNSGKNYTLIAASEGASVLNGSQIVQADSKQILQGERRLGGIGQFLANELEGVGGYEARSVTLGHVQRGGTPVAYDRILSTELGVKAMELMSQGKWNHMVTLAGPKISQTPLTKNVFQAKEVQLTDSVLQSALRMGISFASPHVKFSAF